MPQAEQEAPVEGEAVPRIAMLPTDVVEKIAAGEVVERPASVLKELVENAIDAQALFVRVDIEDAGSRLVRVRDNGEGMDPADAALALHRHATSKIRTAEDLAGISTNGFRGEALSAIAAVSRVVLTTRDDGRETATVISAEGGAIIDTGETARARGTTIEVRDLFYNTPARLKFLKSRQTERARLLAAFEELALAHPEIGFELFDREKAVYQLPAATDPRERISAILSSATVPFLVPIAVKHLFLSITGHITKPQYSQNARMKNYLFINKRPVSNRMLNFAIADAYRPFLPAGAYPVVVLFLDINNSLIDVNVHPAKREIRLSREREIFSLLKDGIISTIQNAILPSLGAIKSAPGTPASNTPQDPLALRQKIAVEKSIYTYLRTAGAPSNMPRTPYAGVPYARPAAGLQSAGSVHTETATQTHMPLGSDETMRIADLKPLGQHNRLYIVSSQGDTMVLIDQHAAQERIMFERLLSQLEQGSVVSQELLVPYTWELPHSDAAMLGRHIPMLAALKIDIEPFGDRAFILRSLPDAFGTVGNIHALLSGILEQITLLDEGTGQLPEPPPAIREKIASAACKASITANRELSLAEMQGIITDLAACDNPYYCPHGRPTLIKINTDELNRRFERT